MSDNSEYVEGLVRRIQRNIGNTSMIGNGLPSTMAEVEMLAKHESNSCICSACRLILQRKPKMLTETEIREHLACICPSGEPKDEFTRGFKAAMEIVLGIHNEVA